MIALIIIFCIIILIAVLISIPLYFDIQYTYDEKTGNAQVILKYLCFKINLLPTKQKKEKNFDKKNDKKDNKETNKKFSIDDFKKYVDNFFLLWDDICKVIYILFKKAIYVKQVSIKSYFGFDDPMTTGMVTGILNAMAYNVLALIERYSNLERREVVLNPDFDKPCFTVDACCIIKIKIVHIIVIAVKVLRMFFKIK